jgi:hypothetical protein
MSRVRAVRPNRDGIDRDPLPLRHHDRPPTTGQADVSESVEERLQQLEDQLVLLGLAGLALVNP